MGFPSLHMQRFGELGHRAALEEDITGGELRGGDSADKVFQQRMGCSSDVPGQDGL